MMIGATGHVPASERIPPALALQLVDLMAQQRMQPETMHMLSLCPSDDALIVVGSDLQIRLQILSIDDGLNTALDPEKQDPKNPPKHFERLLERFDDLRKCLPDTDDSIITETWPSMRAAIVRQAALSHVRARGNNCGRHDDKIDWGAISLEEYLEYVDRLIPLAAQDMDALDDVEQMTVMKEKRNLTDVFMEKRRVVNGVKVRILIKENRLPAFGESMRAFTRGLDSAVLPTPKLLQRYSVTSLLEEDVGAAVGETRGLMDGLQGSSSTPSPSLEKLARASPKRRRAENLPAGSDVPESAQVLAKANEHLQREMTGHPGTLAEALAIGDTIPQPQPRNSAQEKSSDTTASGASGPGERSTEPARKRALTTRSSPGKQVDFDDSQSVDEPQPRGRRATLADRPLPQREPSLESPVGTAHVRKRPKLSVPASTARPRVPWTEEEVKHLEAAVSALGVGKWKQALSLYKFQDCRTAVDLKDKWRNIMK